VALCRSPAQWLALEYRDRQARAPAEQDLMMPVVARRVQRGPCPGRLPSRAAQAISLS
jgi:hypothetical protein